jgi:hypothetical protein
VALEAGSSVELTDEAKEAILARILLRGKLGDLLSHAVER